jgi:hypothetical protein
MATTTNYGWTTPDDTALVKDGASAIRTLGSSVDTTTKALNPSTTLGDIEYRSSTANTNTRLGVGTTGQVLTVSGGVPSWATASSGGMTLISTTTISNNATVSLTSIPQTYNNLFVVIRNYKPATAYVGLKMRFNSDSGANRHKLNLIDDASAYSGSFAFDDTNSKIADFNDTATGTGLITVTIPDYTNANTFKMGNFKTLANSDVSGEFYYRSGSAAYNQTTAITSLDFFSASGNLTSGTILLYGVK